MYLTSIPANMITGSLMELLGPKRLVTISLIPGIVLWIILSYPANIIGVYAPRICLGMLLGLLNTAVQPLSTELCEPSIRGFVTG